MSSLRDRIELLYAQCANNPNGTADLKSVMRIFWPVLNNSVSMIDIGNLYGVAISGTAHSHQAALDRRLFTEFLNSFARLKYPASTDFTTQLLDELTSAKSVKIMETPFMNKAFERHAIRVLTKFDLPLRRAFCNFAGSGANIGVGVTWEEVKRLDMGMEMNCRKSRNI